MNFSKKTFPIALLLSLTAHLLLFMIYNPDIDKQKDEEEYNCIRIVDIEYRENQNIREDNIITDNPF